MTRKEIIAEIQTQEDLENAVVGYFNGQAIQGEMLSRWAFNLLWGAIQISKGYTPEILEEEKT